ncbi:choice-of-anchor I family protein [Fibrobacter sp. UBA4297]|uniref:choice-of-anchor I family protein n=1 Tax=Fibrobacter sp. UBA4297 TaxID=1946536 RepID=UPI0025C38883|nr:choice-of-anchor I family protein [Fibrobacter sp. UBA4297]
MKKTTFVLSLLIGSGIAFAKKSDVPVGPFQWGTTLKHVASVPMTTAEISAFMPEKKVLFVVGGENVLEVVDIADPANPQKLSEMKLSGGASSVTVHGDLVAVSLLNSPEWEMGHVQVMRYNKKLEVLGKHELCYMPDMITFTPDGANLLVACEGSPEENFNEDPEGGIGVLSIDAGVVGTAKAAKAWVKPQKVVVDFKTLDSLALMAKGVRKTGVKSFVQSLEPEYITVSEDSKIAWVSLQENNAIVKFDVASKKILDVFPLGYVDHSKPGYGLDIKKNKQIEIKNYPLRGLRQPDGISAFTAGGKTFVLTANEGAPVNDYKAWTDETTPMVLLQNGVLDPNVFTAEVLADVKGVTVSNLERCNVTPNKTENGLCPYMYSFGTRSISIFDGESGHLMWDSGDAFEQMMAKVAPYYFNWNSKKGKVKMDARSEDKGCEPENVTTGIVGDKRYAFVGLERASAIVVLDITGTENGNSPNVVDFYLNPKDRGPEGILFIPAEKSPNGEPLLVVGYEYSKTLAVYSVK